MRTIQKQLQSRISKRRNFIRYVEEQINISIFQGQRELVLDWKSLRKELAEDQKLDKDVMNFIVAASATGLTDLIKDK